MDREVGTILNDNDLEYYRQKLDKITYEDMGQNQSPFCTHLNKCKGKLVKVEICSSGCKTVKSGTLLEVGEDFISIRMGNSPVSIAIPINNILSITLIHNNDKCQINR